MTLRLYPLPSVPDATAAAVRAAFPKGNLYVELRTKPRQHMLYVYASLSRLDFQGLSENATVVF